MHVITHFDCTNGEVVGIVLRKGLKSYSSSGKKYTVHGIDGVIISPFMTQSTGTEKSVEKLKEKSSKIRAFENLSFLLHFPCICSHGDHLIAIKRRFLITPVYKTNKQNKSGREDNFIG